MESMKIDILTVDKPEAFFIIEQNTLNNNWMVYSEYAQLPQCFAFKGKKSASTACASLNKTAFDEYDGFIENERRMK